MYQHFPEHTRVRTARHLWLICVHERVVVPGRAKSGSRIYELALAWIQECGVSKPSLCHMLPGFASLFTQHVGRHIDVLLERAESVVRIGAIVLAVHPCSYNTHETPQVRRQYWCSLCECAYSTLVGVG